MKIILITVLIFSFCSTANSQMAVFDANALAQTTTMVEQGSKALEQGQKVYEKVQESYEIAKKTSEQIGQAVSLSQSAYSWVNGNSEDLNNCLVPKVTEFMPNLNIKTHSLCNSQDFIRRELGIPTSRDVEQSVNGSQSSLEDWGDHDWKKAIKTDNNGNTIINLPPKVIAEKRKKREQFANDSRLSAVGVANSILKDKISKQLDGLSSISNSLKNTPQSTNGLLLQLNSTMLGIYEAQIQQNAILASMLQMLAGNSLESSGLTIQE